MYANGYMYVPDDRGFNLLSPSNRWRLSKVVRVPLAAVDGGGAILSWQNPETVPINVTRIDVDLTTKATAACTADFGTTAASATTSSDNLLDGVDLGTAAGLFSNLNDPGANGKAGGSKLAVGAWLTGSKATGAAAGLVGYAYITYTPLT